MECNLIKANTHNTQEKRKSSQYTDTDWHGLERHGHSLNRPADAVCQDNSGAHLVRVELKALIQQGASKVIEFHLSHFKVGGEIALKPSFELSVNLKPKFSASESLTVTFYIVIQGTHTHICIEMMSSNIFYFILSYFILSKV